MKKSDTYKSKAEKLLKEQKRRIKNLQKRGYIIQDIPTLPKRIGKKEYERLKKQLTLEKIYDSPKNFYFDKENQRMVSAKKGRELERSKASKKGWEKRKNKDNNEDYPDWYDIVYQGIIEQINGRGSLPWNKSNANILLQILENAIKEEGRKQALQRIYENEQQIQFIIDWILPPSPRPQQEGFSKIPQFAELLKGGKLDEWEQVQIEDYMYDIGMFEYDYDEKFDGEFDTYY